MSRETIRKNLPFITAYAEGKTVELRFVDREKYSDGWDSVLEHSWSVFADPDFEFRIKPEPREFWVFRDEANQEWGISDYEPDLDWDEVIRVREVIEE